MYIVWWHFSYSPCAWWKGHRGWFSMKMPTGHWNLSCELSPKLPLGREVFFKKKSVERNTVGLIKLYPFIPYHGQDRDFSQQMVVLNYGKQTAWILQKFFVDWKNAVSGARHYHFPLSAAMEHSLRSATSRGQEIPGTAWRESWKSAMGGGNRQKPPCHLLVEIAFRFQPKGTLANRRCFGQRSE